MIKSCLDCIHHKVINDPDPNDCFCDDDLAVVCTISKHPTQNPDSKYASDRQPFRPVDVAIRPYRLEKESAVPYWCPKKSIEKYSC